jgi:hypothetical protein
VKRCDSPFHTFLYVMETVEKMDLREDGNEEEMEI